MDGLNLKLNQAINIVEPDYDRIYPPTTDHIQTHHFNNAYIKYTPNHLPDNCGLNTNLGIVFHSRTVCYVFSVSVTLYPHTVDSTEMSVTSTS